MDLLILICLLIMIIILLVLLFKSGRNQKSLELKLLNEKVNSLDKTLRDEMRSSREENRIIDEQMREGLMNSFQRQSETIDRNLESFSKALNELMRENITQAEKNRNTIENRLQQIQTDNNLKLEKMRETVDEKLQSSLDKRINEAFETVIKQLRQVEHGLGEMQNLAKGVGDIKKVLDNVKERGTWGEVKLAAILEEILTPEQFEGNVQVKPRSQERVDFAVKLPGNSTSQPLWLPIDAKFPRESYVHLVEASKKGDKNEVAKYEAALMRAIKKAAADIRDKYINPPYTTDFAIMFLPTEGLYSEVLRSPGTLLSLQHDYRIVVAGPTTISAIMNSLRMGFRTLAIEKKASEVWQYLRAVKTQFRLFGDVMDRLKKQMDKVTKTIDQTSDRTRIMNDRLRALEQLSENESNQLLHLQDIANSEDNIK